MTPDLVIQIVRDMLLLACWLCAPVLLAAFVVGILMSLVQIVTSIQDTAFATIPRLAAFLGALLFSMPWMLKKMMVYATVLMGDLGRYAR